MKRLIETVSLVLLSGLAIDVGAPAGLAGIIFDTSEADFDPRATALATQTFNGAHVPTGLAVESSSLTNSTNDQVFSSGTILHGVSFSSSNAGLGRDLEVSGAGPGSDGGIDNYANNVLHPAFYFSPLQVSFSSGQSAVGLGLLSAYVGPNYVLEDTVSVYSTTGVLLGTMVDSAPIAGAGSFLGILTTGGDRIGSISIAATSASFQDGTYSEPGLDRVLFSPSAVPEPASATLLGIGLLRLAARAARRSSRHRVPR